MEGRGRQTASHLDLAAPHQGCIPAGCEVHLHMYLLSAQVRQGKVEVHTSVQVQMREVAGSEPFLTCIYGLFVRHFLIKTIVQGVIQGIASAGILLYIVVQLKDK